VLDDARSAQAMPSSQRVRLEPAGPHVESILAGVPDPALPWAPGFPSPPLRAFLAEAASTDSYRGPFYAYLIVRQSDGAVVGDAGFHGPPGPEGEVEIGYSLVPQARGAGLATEAVGLLASWARAQPGVEAVIALIDASNEASLRLARRLGFSFDGPKGELQRYVLR
jgi:RimJ/RimL family protein N-acetyltransferase